jgi:hypothetical protein
MPEHDNSRLDVSFEVAVRLSLGYDDRAIKRPKAAAISAGISEPVRLKAQILEGSVEAKVDPGVRVRAGRVAPHDDHIPLGPKAVDLGDQLCRASGVA